MCYYTCGYYKCVDSLTRKDEQRSIATLSLFTVLSYQSSCMHMYIVNCEWSWMSKVHNISIYRDILSISYNDITTLNLRMHEIRITTEQISDKKQFMHNYLETKEKDTCQETNLY